MGSLHWSLGVAIGVVFIGMAFASPSMRHPPRMPPGFEKALPPDVRQKLKAIHENPNLNFTERHEQIDKIMSSLPDEVLDKLPPPPGFEKLPKEVQDQLKSIRRNKSLNWREKHEKVREFIDSLPEEQRKLLPPPPPPPFFPPFGPRGLPPRPPPGFEKVLPSEVYQRLLAVHENTNISVPEKMQKIDEIMKEVPKETLEKLPLPPGFDKLPEDTQKQARAILFNMSISFKERMKALKKFTKSLPKEQRKMVRPQPPGFENLPQDIREKIDAIFEDDQLDHRQKHEKIRELIDSLPQEIRSKLPPPPPFGMPPPPFGMPPPPPFGNKMPPPPPPGMDFE
uniref:Uncharacterized protein n=1 Tax=Acrobeloides nanus TaxID=290746 RepID=A0A914C405_9BILA